METLPFPTWGLAERHFRKNNDREAKHLEEMLSNHYHQIVFHKVPF